MACRDETNAGDIPHRLRATRRRELTMMRARLDGSGEIADHILDRVCDRLLPVLDALPSVPPSGDGDAEVPPIVVRSSRDRDGSVLARIGGASVAR